MSRHSPDSEATTCSCSDGLRRCLQMLRLPGESTSEISRKIRESFANVPLKSRFPAWGPPTFPKLYHPVLVAGTRIGLSCAWLYLAQLSNRCCKWPWVAVETFNHLLGSCCKMSLPILWYYGMFRLMLARHGCRTMLRDEAAKDPRKISFFREEWPFQDERILINHHIFLFFKFACLACWK